MHLFLSAEESERFLVEELPRAVPGATPVVLAPGLLGADFAADGSQPAMWRTPSPPPSAGERDGERGRSESPGHIENSEAAKAKATLTRNIPLLAFARQMLPDAIAVQAPSINAWAGQLFDAIIARVPEQQPWHLHIDAHYGAAGAGQNRCELIRERVIELLGKKRRQLRRGLVKEPQAFAHDHSLVQLLLTGPEAGFLSITIAPQPHAWRGVLSPFPKGDVPIAEDKAAPSRAFTKLVEAELRMGRRISAGESCVDLGASPGSWSYVALQRNAQVIAVDRSPLREDLMRNPRLKFEQGDAFKFRPAAPVDWLLCDVIAAPQRSIDLVLDWVRERQARRFVVTIKFKGHEEYAVLDSLKTALPPRCEEVYLSRLCANKNEVCVFGVVK